MKVSGSQLMADDGKAVKFVRSPNQSAGVQPRFLIMHYTAGVSAQSAVEWLTNPAAKASAHFVIGRDGHVTQLVGLDKRAWHAGESQWGQLNGMNRFSIGIEMVNAGRLRRSEAGEWFSWSSVKIPAADVLVVQHKAESAPAGWQIYPEPQINAVFKVMAALHAAFEFEGILGHEDVAPGRKVDPGPAFPLASLASRVLGRKN